MELITLRTFQNYFTAHILLTRLRDAGFPCYLKDEFTVTTEPFLSNAIGGIKLVVRKSDEEEASALLLQLDENFRKTATCTRCGGQTIDRVPKQNTAGRVMAILTWLLGNYAIPTKNVYHCTSCHYESETLPGSAPEDSPEDVEARLH